MTWMRMFGGTIPNIDFKDKELVSHLFVYFLGLSPSAQNVTVPLLNNELEVNDSLRYPI